MRQVAVIPDPSGEVRRVMVYDTEGAGTYLFLYHTLDDGPSSADYWFETVASAVKCAQQEFGIRPDDWRSIPDPPSGCQDDWVAPMRIKPS